MSQAVENRLPLLLPGTLLLLASGWYSSLAAGNLADIPLTEATPESQNLDSRKLNQAISKIDNREYGNYAAEYRRFFDLLRDHIFPAVLD